MWSNAAALLAGFCPMPSLLPRCLLHWTGRLVGQELSSPAVIPSEGASTSSGRRAEACAALQPATARTPVGRQMERRSPLHGARTACTSRTRTGARSGDSWTSKRTTSPGDACGGILARGHAWVEGAALLREGAPPFAAKREPATVLDLP